MITSPFVLMHSLRAGNAQKKQKPRIGLAGFSGSWGVQHGGAAGFVYEVLPIPSPLLGIICFLGGSSHWKVIGP